MESMVRKLEIGKQSVVRNNLTESLLISELKRQIRQLRSDLQKKED